METRKRMFEACVRLGLGVLVILVVSAAFGAEKAQIQTRRYTKLHVSPDLSQRLAKWRSIEMPFNSSGLSAHEREMVEKLVEASQLLDDIYWRQSDPQGLELYKSLAANPTPQNAPIRRFLMINGCRFDLLDHNTTFVGTEPFSPGHGFYPRGLTREEIERYVAQHPAQKAEIYNPYTVVRRHGGELVTIPYTTEYKTFLTAAAGALREAAALSADRAFAKFLRLRADALLSDDYYPSDVAWLDLKDPKVDVIMAPYETYLDDVLGVKTSYGSAVLIRNDAESRKLKLYEKYIPEIQQALPIPAEDRPSKQGHVTPMEVVDSPFRGGDLRHGYQAVADNLPNDARIHAEKGTKKIFFKNFMDARVNYVILPLAKKVMRPADAAKASANGYMAGTILHEISHGLGPAFARVNGKQTDIRESVGPVFSGLEESKADVVGMYGLKWLVDRGAMSLNQMDEDYASYVAGIFRTVRYGTAEAHGQAEMMEFNYLFEQGAITRDAATGRYAVNYERMPGAIARLAHELLETEATGDRTRAKAWFKKYEVMPAELARSLAAASDVPVDVDPVFSSFREEVR